MNTGSTNIRVVGAAGAATAILFWILGYFAPDFMATAPAGAEAAVTTLIAALAGRLAGENMFMGGNQDGAALSGFLVWLIAVSLLVSCASVQTPRISDSLGATALAIETAAIAVHEACRNEVPRGPCAEGALITTDQKETARTRLAQAASLLDLAIAAYAAGKDVEGQSHLERIAALLGMVEEVLP